MKNAEYLIKSRTTGLGLLDTWRWDRQVVPKRRYGITALRWLIPHKSAVIMYITAQDWNQATSLSGICPCVSCGCFYHHGSGYYTLL